MRYGPAKSRIQLKVALEKGDSEMYPPEDQLNQALERIKRFQAEAEKYNQAKTADKEKVRSNYTFRQRFGFALVRVGIKLAGKVRDF
jgi:hypothetical protein